MDDDSKEEKKQLFVFQVVYFSVMYFHLGAVMDVY
jgi:hypothetical protein